MKRPVDNKDIYGSLMQDYACDLFWGRRIIPEKRNAWTGDGTTIKFWDESVIKKIQPDKRYKCWYKHSFPSDPADSSDAYFFAYIEEVPENICECERLADSYVEILKNYLKSEPIYDTIQNK